MCTSVSSKSAANRQVVALTMPRYQKAGEDYIAKVLQCFLWQQIALQGNVYKL